MCEVSRAKGEWHSRTRIKHSFAITQTEELNQPYGCVRSPPKKHTSLGREMSVCFVIISKMLCIESVVRIVWMRCCSVDWRRYGWYSEAYIPRTPADSVYGVLSLRCLGAPQLLPDCLPACVSVYASVCDVCVCAYRREGGEKMWNMRKMILDHQQLFGWLVGCKSGCQRAPKSTHRHSRMT